MSLMEVDRRVYVRCGHCRFPLKVNQWSYYCPRWGKTFPKKAFWSTRRCELYERKHSRGRTPYLSASNLPSQDSMNLSEESEKVSETNRKSPSEEQLIEESGPAR